MPGCSQVFSREFDPDRNREDAIPIAPHNGDGRRGNAEGFHRDLRAKCRRDVNAIDAVDRVRKPDQIAIPKQRNRLREGIVAVHEGQQGNGGIEEVDDWLEVSGQLLDLTDDWRDVLVEDIGDINLNDKRIGPGLIRETVLANGNDGSTPGRQESLHAERGTGIRRFF